MAGTIEGATRIALRAINDHDESIFAGMDVERDAIGSLLGAVDRWVRRGRLSDGEVGLSRLPFAVYNGHYEFDTAHLRAMDKRNRLAAIAALTAWVEAVS